MAKPLNAYQFNFGIGLNVDKKLHEADIVSKVLDVFNFKSVLFETVKDMMPFRKTLIQRTVNEDLDVEVKSDLEISFDDFYKFKYSNFISPNELFMQINLYDEKKKVSHEHEFNILDKCKKPNTITPDTEEIHEFKCDLVKPEVKPHHILVVKMQQATGQYKHRTDYTLIKIN